MSKIRRVLVTAAFALTLVPGFRQPERSLLSRRDQGTALLVFMVLGLVEEATISHAAWLNERIIAVCGAGLVAGPWVGLAVTVFVTWLTVAHDGLPLFWVRNGNCRPERFRPSIALADMRSEDPIVSLRLPKTTVLPERLFMRLAKGSFAVPVLAGILAMMPAAAFAHGGGGQGGIGGEYGFVGGGHAFGGFTGRGSSPGFSETRGFSTGRFSGREDHGRFGDRGFRDHRVLFQQFAWPVYWSPYYPYDYSDLDYGPDNDYQDGDKGQFSPVCATGVLQTRRRPWPACRQHQRRELPAHGFNGQS